jgi:hypothetical protein
VDVFAELILFSASYAMVDRPGDVPLPGSDIARWLDLWDWIPVTFLPLTFVFLLFPDGRLPAPRWRLVAWPAWAWQCTSSAQHCTPPADRADPATQSVWPPRRNLRAGTTRQQYNRSSSGRRLRVAGALVVRFRRSRGIEREQVR